MQHLKNLSVEECNKRAQRCNQSEIARILHVDKSIISRDIAYLREQAKDNIKKYIDERLPEEYEKCLIGLNAITKEAWNTAHNTEDKREKIQALSLSLKPLDNSNKVQEEESKEPGYNEDVDLLEEKQE
jgi:hypothetical protein